MEHLASETFSELRPPECGFPISVDVSSLDTASTWLALYRVEAAWSRYVSSVTCGNSRASLAEVSSSHSEEYSQSGFGFSDELPASIFFVLVDPDLFFSSSSLRFKGSMFSVFTAHKTFQNHNSNKVDSVDHQETDISQFCM